MSEKRTTEILVIGAGIAGLMTAWELARAGKRVAVLERGQPGREASRAAAGILAPLPPWRYPPALLALTDWSRQVWPQFAHELEQRSGLPVDYTASGLLYFHEPEFANALAWATPRGVVLESLTAAEVARHESALTANPRPALRLPGVAQVMPGRLLRALQEAVLAEGVRILPHAGVQVLHTANGRITGVACEDGDWQAEQVVLCAGAWSAELLAPLGIALPVEPVRGQILQYAAPPGLVGHILLEDGKYLVPRREGKILVGSTREHVGFDKTTTDAGAVELTDAAERLLPLLAQAGVTRHWAGLRPGNPDQLPFIGGYPDLPGLIVNTGHYSTGIVAAPAAARLVADMLLARQPILDPAPYAPSRGL